MAGLQQPKSSDPSGSFKTTLTPSGQQQPPTPPHTPKNATLPAGQPASSLQGACTRVTSFVISRGDNFYSFLWCVVRTNDEANASSSMALQSHVHSILNNMSVGTPNLSSGHHSSRNSTDSLKAVGADFRFNYGHPQVI